MGVFKAKARELVECFKEWHTKDFQKQNSQNALPRYSSGFGGDGSGS